MKRRRVRIFLFISIVVSLGIVGFLDYKTGAGVSLAFFYLIPVSLAVLLGGARGGIICSIIASAVFMVTELPNATWPVALWNAVQRLGILLVVGVLLSVITRKVGDALVDDKP